MKKITNKRVDYIDIARGITILLMIIGHVLDFGLTKDLIYSYHMPFFVIISGFFFKEDEKPIELLKKNITKIYFTDIHMYIIGKCILSYICI